MYKDEEWPGGKKENEGKLPGAMYHNFATFPFIYFKNKDNLDAINTNIPYDTKAIKLPWKGPADEDLNDVLRVCKPVYVGLDRYLRGRLSPEISIVFRCKDLETAKTITIRIGNEKGELKGQEEELIDKDIRTVLAKTPDCRKWNVQSIELVGG
ncbi:hypothetical protein HYALB_00000468 [Hymenoscyphus albidus]|uniref:Uncharacterized protein n=1 Tax=Hymenoscyphus albidus TaxID=595503 RepID=A0A9N9LJH1_9HELO|nr:hypothetical protein HYALB_00000468 [Hymenoscyphus albidus]